MLSRQCREVTDEISECIGLQGDSITELIVIHGIMATLFASKIDCANKCRPHADF